MHCIDAYKAHHVRLVAQLRISLIGTEEGMRQAVFYLLCADDFISHLEALLQMLIELQDCRNVAASITVVRRRPDRHKCVVKHGLMPFHH
ncbi:hypothetical protein PsorP6_003972 [Peronosclerospora sorghi]|uniref:Uncharacterized protein n=1 Tax=Peronosclerospora sorghi TaxID=230839 RepID=A0ACC0VR64_9STRA|nr:hypothetical protein PsorP6_003972 [Peronosclerospora sorghi]